VAKNAGLDIITKLPFFPVFNGSNRVLSGAARAEIRPRLAGVKPNSAKMRIMISAWRLAMET